MSNADSVREFHAVAGSPFPKEPVLPVPEMLALRRTLIEEEYKEVMVAFERLTAVTEFHNLDESLAPLLHELADLLYVTYGAMLVCGVDADAIFAEVHAANMRKTGGPLRADGKLLKPPDWQPANVQKVVKAMMTTAVTPSQL